MDEMKIQTTFMKSLISKIISGKLKKKLGHNCDVKVHNLCAVNNGDRTAISIALDLEADTTDLPKILEHLGIM